MKASFRLHLAVPGVEPGNLRVTVLPQSIIVRTDAAHQHDKRHGQLHFCEFGERRLMRRFELATPIDVDRVSASLDKGMLEITAAKASKAEHGRPVKVMHAA